MSKVWDLDLKSTDKFVLIALADHANDDGECYPSLANIQKKVGLSKQGLLNIINRLIELKVLSKETRDRDNGSHTSNLYKITVENMEGVVNDVDKGGQRGGQGVVNEVDKGSQRGGLVYEPSINRQLETSVESSPKPPVEKNGSNQYSEIVTYLNEKTGSSYRSNTPKTKQLIDARMKEGFTVDDFKTVIDKKTALWLKDTKMVAYLRPETLFGPKFEGYLNEHVSTARAMASAGAISETTAHNIEVAQSWSPKNA